MKHDFKKFLDGLDLHDSEMFGLFGRGFPGSFYKVYVRAQPKEKWWLVKNSAEPVQYDPMECEKKIAVRDRVGNVWGPLAYVSHTVLQFGGLGVAYCECETLR